MESGGIVPLLKPINIHSVATRSNRLPDNIAPYVSPEPSFLPMANSDSVREMGKVFYHVAHSRLAIVRPPLHQIKPKLDPAREGL